MSGIEIERLITEHPAEGVPWVSVRPVVIAALTFRRDSFGPCYDTRLELLIGPFFLTYAQIEPLPHGLWCSISNQTMRLNSGETDARGKPPF